jgi:tetratricopeptide (TPR) repeat protein
MPDKPKDALNQALEAIRRADFPEAIEILGSLVVKDGANGEAWQQLGVCYLETRQPDLALEALTRALEHGTPDATTHFLLGHAYGSTGQLEAAATCYRRALEADPNHAGAEDFLIKTESLLESRDRYRNGLKLLYSPEPAASDLERALRELVESVAIFGDSPARANLRECAQKILECRSDRAIPVVPDPELEPWIRACERGYYCIAVKNWAGGQDAYQEALSYRAGDDFVHHALGFCFVALDLVGDAVQAWMRLLELNPAYPFAQFGRIELQRDERVL